jgi:TRAP-type uncharacterized transport system substrate-binding protein
MSVLAAAVTRAAPGRLLAAPLIALHSEALAVNARADTGIRRFEDLRGKRVSVGKSGLMYARSRTSSSHRRRGDRRAWPRLDVVPSSVVTPIHPGALKYYREVGSVR